VKFTKWVARLFGSAEKKTETQEEAILKWRRESAARLTVLKISERMKARPERMAFYKKQRMRALKRVKVLSRKSMGIVDDEEFGQKYPQMSLLEAQVKS
jgi:hypothetical protein